MAARPAEQLTPPAIQRLSSLAEPDAEALSVLRRAAQRARRYRPRAELLVEGQEIGEAVLLLRGWAARIRTLEDGRRQILSFVLPGDLIGMSQHERPIAPATVVAMTEVEVCTAPDAAVSPALARMYAAARAHEEVQLLAHIARLGRLNAYERIADLLLELLERLEAAGLALAGRMEVPLTQEVLADALGLTAVHVNRMVQTLRREGQVNWKGREVAIPEPAMLHRRVGRPRTRISAGL